MLFVNYVGYANKCPVTNYVEPGVEKGWNNQLLVTVNDYAKGVNAQDLGRNAPTAWITDENIVRTMARWWKDYRQHSIEFTEIYDEVYERLPEWDTY